MIGCSFIWRNLFFRRRLAASFCLLLAVPVFAQSPGLPITSIQLSAAQSYVLSGRSIQFQAAATGLFGASVPDFRPNWRSSNPAIAAVDAAGLVRGLIPGIADIEAQ